MVKGVTDAGAGAKEREDIKRTYPQLRRALKA